MLAILLFCAAGATVVLQSDRLPGLELTVATGAFLLAGAIAAYAFVSGRRAGGRAAPARSWVGGRPSPGTLPFELERAKRARLPVSLVTVVPDDLDLLATAGREALAGLLDAIGAAIEDAVRTVDVVERHGEQRFSLILPGTDSVAARTVAERVRLQVDAARPEGEPGRPLGLTVSIGIASYPVDGDRAEVLEAAAARARAHAVELGGNRTLLHSVPPTAPRGWGVSSPGAERARSGTSPRPRG